MQKTALITGQDGAYLAQLLLGKSCAVYSAYRRTSTVNFWRMEKLRTSKLQISRPFKENILL